MDDGRAGLSLRERQKAQTRAHLLSTATALIAAKGFTATSIDDIAKAAGSSRATVYSYFESKDAILSELIRSMWDDADDLYRTFGALREWSRASVRDWVELVIRRHEADAQRNRAALEASFVGVIQDQEADHQRHIDSLTLASELWLERFTPAEARARASMIISMIEGYTTRWFLHRVKPESTSAIEQITDVLMDMLHAN
ncbi:TetR/AcrR family transcriptional regulator [Streptomyces viridiviolaceus]